MKKKKINVLIVVMSGKNELKLDWCGYKAVKFACENWHYSKCTPAGKMVKIGVWENKEFKGCILYSLGAGNMTDGTKYGLAKTHEVCELSRVALKDHIAPVSQMLSISIKMLKKQSPGVKLIISFADELSQNHFGGIYQASNFIYTGTFESTGSFKILGKKMHMRSVYSKGWKQSLPWLKKNIDKHAEYLPTKKHRYLYPLTEEVKKRVLNFEKPYPKMRQ
jgi:hypothetical protein